MIETENLTKRYGRSEAIANVTLAVPANSVFALVGPNGAGKSTMIKVILNLIHPSVGRATVMGVDSRRLGVRQLAEIGYVSEGQKLPEWMHVGHLLTHLEALYPSWDRALAGDLIREYDLPLDRPIRALSRGMKMKSALVASLAYRPRLIVLDEPFSGLDILVREQLVESIIDRTPEATVLMASHDLSEIESFATHVGYLNNGQLEFMEEMASLSARFREIEVTLEQPADLPAALPSTWLNAQKAGVAVRFVDSSYDFVRCTADVARYFTAVRQINAREMSFRSIFLALAKSRRAQ